MAKEKFEMSQKLDLVGVVDRTADDRLVFIVDGEEYDAIEILDRIVGYSIKIVADLPVEV